MLIDKILHAPRTDGLPNPYRLGFHGLLKNAVKFDLAPDFAATAEALAYDFRAVADAIPYCRLPYESIWVEVARTFRPRMAASGIHVPEFQSLPHRVGFLLHSTHREETPDPLNRFAVYQCWDIERDPEFTAVCPVIMSYDPAQITPDVAVPDTTRAERMYWPIEKAPQWEAADQRTRNILSSVCTPVPTPWETEIQKAIFDGHLKEAGMQFELAIADWSGEAIYLLAVLALLSSANGSERELVTKEKLNKARAKSGKPPMQNFYTLKIHTKLKKRFAGDGKDHYSELRAHMCRGHFKVRKSGVFFWRPHMRGNKDKGIIHKSYEVAT